jgi:hypothetical protein
VPQDPDTIANNPEHPNYWKQNLADLKGESAERRQAAMERLAATGQRSPPADVRRELAQAMRDRAFARTDPADSRVKAIEQMVRWGGRFSAPLLVELLKDEEPTVRQAVLAQLAPLRHPDAIEPIVEYFFAQAEGREAAATAIKSYGSAAEEALLKHAPKDDAAAIRAVLPLLAEIGTPKSAKYLASLRTKKKIVAELGQELQTTAQAISARRK